MNGSTLKYFACANTGKGFANHFASNLAGMNRIYILKGGPGTGKSTMMKKVASYFADKKATVECIYCSSDRDSLDGVIIPSLKAAVVDGTAPHVIEPTAPGAIEEYVNLGTAWDCSYLRNRRSEILSLNGSISECYKNVYENFARAKPAHDDWKNIYISNMNFTKASRITDKLIGSVFADIRLEQTPVIRKRFLGAITPFGFVNHIDNLTDGLKQRYFIKGRPGTGKSTLLRKMAEEAVSRGCNAELYYCGFDPDSLDMVILRDLGVCAFDANAPHELAPSRDGDEIIDLYDGAVTRGTDERNEARLSRAAERFRDCINNGVEYLAKAKSLHDQLEQIYIKAVNFEKIDRMTNELIFELNILNQF